MPATKFAVVYSVALSRTRRVILPDENADLARHALLPGEAWLLLDIADFPPITFETFDARVFDAIVADTTGRPTLSDACNVVDASGNIVMTMLADPSIDAAPEGCTLELA